LPTHHAALIVPHRTRAPSTPGDWRWPLILILALTAWRLLIAGTVPVTQDEAYYFNWAQSLAWGYFDHPPGVALLGIGSWIAPGSAFAARLGTIIAGTLTLLILWRFYRACGLTRDRDLLLALVLAAGTVPGMISGVITTPDTVLALCWALALHEALAALQGNRKRWLTAGLATGLGLLGKYTMVVIGPVFLWAILLADPRALRTLWPYLGGLLALLLFLPNIAWNADNDWLTMRFQFGHGFSAETGRIVLAAHSLPAATGPMAYSPPQTGPLTPADRLASLGGYLGSQLAFWGMLLLPLAAAPFVQGGLHRIRRDLTTSLSAPAGTLLTAGILVPLMVFGAVSLISDVEANWSALYLACAAPVAAIMLQPLARWASAAAATNLLLVSLYAFHAATGLLPLPSAADRIMRETHGYAALANHAASLPGPVFADRYAFAAMLNFYRPELAVPQWPGISRPSEYGRGRIVPIPAVAALRDSGFWLVAYKFSPPTIPGFTAVATQSTFDCKGQPLQVVAGGVGWDTAICDEPYHGWRIYRYVADGEPSARH
jgi:4-amino-4-deoxy-L-arabinose transferase-like glycosyltransferase